MLTFPLRHLKTLTVIATALFLNACASDNGALSSPGYQSARAQSSLELPPDLINSSDAALSSRTSTKTANVLPKVTGIQLRSEGGERWLEIESNANDVWSQLLDYTTKSGLPILTENKRDGIVKTDWIGDESSDSSIRKKIRARLGNIVGRSPVNDQYTFWLERLGNNTTALHITHNQLKQIVIEPERQDDVVKTAWSETPGDGLKALLLLRKLNAFFGGEEIETDNSAAVVLVETTPPHIIIAEQGELALAQVTRAISASAYTFDREDKKRGLIIIRQAKKEGFLSGLALKKRFGIQLEPTASGTKTRINIVSKRGKPIDREEALPVLYAITGELRR